MCDETENSREAFNLAKLKVRYEAFNLAAALIAPLILENGLKDKEPAPIFAGFFGNNTQTTFDQHLSNILVVADWLLEVT